MGHFSPAAHPLTSVGPPAPPVASTPRRTLTRSGPRFLHYRPRRFFPHGRLGTAVTTDGKESSVADGAVDSIDGDQVIDKPPKIPERDFTGTPYVPVYVMLPLGVIAMDCELIDPDGLLQQLTMLKSANVDGVMVDCWWGIVEAHAPQQYNWSGYKRLFQMVRDGLGIPIGLLVGFFFFIYSKPPAPDDVQEPVVRPLHELDTKTLQALLPEIPSWVKNPDYERVDWLNRFVHDMWPYLDKAICNTIRSMTKPIFAEYIGKYHIESIDFDHLTLGSLPPIIHGVKAIESHEKSLVFEPGIRWASNCNITVTLKLLSLKLTVQVLDPQISLAPRVTLKPLVPCFPCFASLTVCLMEKPHVDFGLKFLGGDLMAIPVLYQFVQDTVAEQIANLYHWPNILEIPILENASEALKKPVGILHVKVVRALNLMKMDFMGKSDPYVKLSLSGEGLPSKKTSIKMSNLNPEWNEQFKFIVKDPETQVLQLHLFDWEKVKMHDKLGMQVIPLSLLTPYETKEFTLDLLKNLNPNDPQNKKNRGKIIVELTFGPFREESAKKFNGYLDGEGKPSIINRASEELSSTGGVLSVTIESAEDVEGRHHNNPYALILFRGERKQTKVVKKTRNPRWNEEFQFVLEEAPINDKIHIQVMSKRRGYNFYPKESLGHVDINLADVVNNGRINEACHLINSKNGVMHTELRWSTI